MKVYLAARYSRYPEIQEYADQLRALGHTVTSRWHLGDHDTVDADGDADKTRFAQEDLDDLLDAHAVVSFTEDPDAPAHGRARGGRHVEFGLALATQVIEPFGLHRVTQRVIVIGFRENVFHWLRAVEFFPDWPAFLDSLTPKAVPS